MRVADFHFDLPEELIAQHPPATRGDSRLLRVDRTTGTCVDDHFRSLPDLLAPGDLLILNDSRVLPARLFATRARGPETQPNSPDPTGRIEVLLTQQLPSGTGENLWSALVRPGRKVQPGETLLFHTHPALPELPVILSEAASQSHRDAAKSKNPEELNPTPTTQTLPPQTPAPTEPILTAEVLAAGDFGERILRFPADPDFLAKLDSIGHIPLPPYLHRPDEAADRSRYQTVYASTPGSAAAPTAGLHFTPEILAALESRGIELAYLTLHVGLGTFQPVRVDSLADVRLHTERYTLPPATAAALNSAVRERRRIIAAGTTTTRTLEHCAAYRPAQTPGRSLRVLQVPTVPSSTLGLFPPATAPYLNSESWVDLTPHSGSTSIFLQPGHRFRLVSGLLTNFHLPQSTLLMLVAAFLSEDPQQGKDRALAAYAHAIQERYRFFSYGDCMLIL